MGGIFLKIRKQHLLVRMVAVLVTIVLGLIAVQQCASQIRVEQQRQIEQNLQDVAEQNVAQVQTVVHDRSMFLSAMALQMSTAEDPVHLIDQFASLVDIYNVKRIGFAKQNGDAYTTDGHKTNYAYQSFFQHSIQGETFLSDVLVDSIGESEKVNVISVPVYEADGSGIMGVMFTTYRTEELSNLLHVESFGEQGTSCMIQEDGYILAAADQKGDIVTGHNLFDDLIESDRANRAAVDELYRRMETEDGTLATCSYDGKEYFFYVKEVGGETGWYLVTIVPTSVLSQRTKPVLANVHWMLAYVIILLLSSVLVYLWTNHQHTQELYRTAYQDPLTQLDNYSAFREKMRNGTGVNGPGYVVSVDLRSFGTVNKTCGVAKGDELIYAMGQTLQEHTERGELLAHVNGDRFVLFLQSASQAELIERIGRLRESIANLSPLLDVPHVVPAFGIRPVDTPSLPEQSYSDANLAKQQVKERAGMFYAFFNEAAHSKALEVQHLEDRFEPALEGREFEMWYQPKYSPETGKMVAAEALVRWRQDDGSMISPGKFIPLFERNGMIAQLDEYTFDMVCAQQRTWKDAGQALVPVSVNLSRASLYFADIVGRYMVIVNKHGIPTDCIELEITESAMAGNGNIEQLIWQFRSCGFRILVDDFGSGYSSLSTLTKKYFDNIKIDKSLTDCIGVPEGDLLLESTIHLAHQFNMTVTAEGVEQASQVEFLKSLSCDNIQGYYYSRPLPVPDFTALLSKPDSVIR